LVTPELITGETGDSPAVIGGRGLKPLIGDLYLAPLADSPAVIGGRGLKRMKLVSFLLFLRMEC